MILETTKALKSLLGTAEWTMSGDDLSTLVIHTEGVKAPTKAQVDAQIKKAAEEEANKVAVKIAILERLGLTEEEASLILA